jgi:hypothetical protein
MTPDIINPNYLELDNDAGYDQSKIKGMLRDYVCGICNGRLITKYHKKSYTFQVVCNDPDCPGGWIVEKRYLENIKTRQQNDTDEIMSNFAKFLGKG